MTRGARLLAAAFAALAAASPPGAAAAAVDLPAAAPPAGVDAPATTRGPRERLEEIRRRVQEAVVYPPRARERGLEGVSRIQFRVGGDGRAADLRTVESSGSDLLDAAALAGARRAGVLPRFYGWIRIPVRFSLEP